MLTGYKNFTITLQCLNHIAKKDHQKKNHQKTPPQKTKPLKNVKKIGKNNETMF